MLFRSIGAADRALTVQKFLDPASTASDFIRPGHVFPLRAKPGGVLERGGHTEASVDLCRMAGLQGVVDHALVGITAHSRVPLRVATLSGLILSALSLGTGLGYLIAKLMFWDSFTLGQAPILVGFFLLTSVQLLFIGLLGEYIGIIFLHVRKRPHVFEIERINFDDDGRSRP